MHVSVSSVKELYLDTARMYAYESVNLLLQLGMHAIDCILCLCTTLTSIPRLQKTIRTSATIWEGEGSKPGGSGANCVDVILNPGPLYHVHSFLTSLKIDLCRTSKCLYCYIETHMHKHTHTAWW